MQHFIHQDSFDHLPPVLKRGRQALIVLTNPEGNYILGHKKIYPQGIVRFVGGGIEPHEDPNQGAARELEEEVGLKRQPHQLKALALIEAHFVETSSQHEFNFELYLYHLQVGNEPLTPADDLDNLVTLTPSQLRELIAAYKNLSPQLATPDPSSPEAKFRWSDYGKFFGFIHELGLDLTQKT